MMPKATFFLVLLCFCSPLFAQPMPSGPDMERHTKAVKPLPKKPMYYYKEGQRTPLSQDFGFVSLRFGKQYQAKSTRHEYYKRIKLVISEVQEPQLLEHNLMAVRLMPGASEDTWNVFADRMSRDKELDYVGRIFSIPAKNKLKNLLVPTGTVVLTYKTRPDQAQIDKVIAKYPVLFKEKHPTDLNTIFLTLQNKQVDPVDLANRMSESGQFFSVSPEWLLIKGKPVSKEKLDSINKGYLDAAPAGTKERMEEQMKKIKKEIEKGRPLEP